MLKRTTLLTLICTLTLATAQAEEMIIGEETLDNGIQFIFEGAVKDSVTPALRHLSEDQTDVHIEARVNWSEQSVPPGAPAGGFVAYLIIEALIRNEATGKVSHISLLPHINLIDNFHYARNMALPGKPGDPYTVIFHVQPPELSQLALHKDWTDGYGKSLFAPQSFKYTGLDFEAIAKATRR